MNPFEPSSHDIVGYLSSLEQRQCSYSSVYTHLSSISYHFRLEDLPSPTSGPLVSMYLKGLKRKNVEKRLVTRRAKPLTKEILKKMIDLLYSREKEHSLRVWRTVWRVNLAFYALLRWDDVCRLRVSLTKMLHPKLMPINDILVL